MKALFVITLCLVAAETAQSSGLSSRIARLYPSLPPLWVLAFFSVPTGLVVFSAARGVVRWIQKVGPRNPALLVSIPLVVIGAALVATPREQSPSSPARLPGPASYFLIEGDASILEAHVTLPARSRVAGGTRQVKIFRLRNRGSVPWVNRWLCRDDPEMNTRQNLHTPDCVRVPDTSAGGIADVRVPVFVANRDGILIATLKMSDGRSWYYRDAPPVRIELDVRHQVKD